MFKRGWKGWCDFPGCDRPAPAKGGYCKTHQQQLRLYGRVFPITPRGKHGNHVRGEEHPRWNEDRLLSSQGYVLVRVPKDHHLSMGNGYAYEHQLVAEQMLGRRLMPGEIVHHKDRDPTNNDPANLEVLDSQSEHMREHLEDFERDEYGRYRGLGVA